MGANVEGDFGRAPIFHTFALSKDENEVRRQKQIINNLKRKGYEKDDDRPRGNVRDDNECKCTE